MNEAVAVLLQRDLDRNLKQGLHQLQLLHRIIMNHKAN